MYSIQLRHFSLKNRLIHSPKTCHLVPSPIFIQKLLMYHTDDITFWTDITEPNIRIQRKRICIQQPRFKIHLSSRPHNSYLFCPRMFSSCLRNSSSISFTPWLASTTITCITWSRAGCWNLSNLWCRWKLVDPLHKPLLVEIMQPLEVFHGNKVLLASTWQKRTQNIEADISLKPLPRRRSRAISGLVRKYTMRSTPTSRSGLLTRWSNQLDRTWNSDSAINPFLRRFSAKQYFWL